MSAEGFGLEQPVTTNDTEEGRAKNRRVELVNKINGIGAMVFSASMPQLFTANLDLMAH